MKQLRAVLLAGVLVGVSLLVAADLLAQQETPAAQPTVTSRATAVEGQTVGEVLVGETVVLRITAPAAGLTPVERADIVASRLSSLLSSGHTWRNLHAGTRDGQAVLLMGDNLLVTADEGEARRNTTTPRQLASTWERSMQGALQGVTVAAVAGTQEQWPTWTKPSTKIVPIVSAGTPGIRLGFAQVSGPEERVALVHAVLQLDARFQRVARVMVFVPSSSLTSVNRVEGTAVTGLLQYTLFKF